MKKVARVKTEEKSRWEKKKEKKRRTQFEGDPKSNQDAGSGAGEGSADAHENELQRFKVSPPRRRRPPSLPSLSFFSPPVGHDRSARSFRAALRPAGCFEKMTGEKETVSRRETNSRGREWKVSLDPRGAHSRLLSRVSEPRYAVRRNGQICLSTL